MLDQWLVGSAISACSIAIHALMMTLVIQSARVVTTKRMVWPSLRLPLVMIATVLVLMVAHTAEVLAWALGYWMTDAVPAGTSLVYFAFVNYTTLGYGDIVPKPDWQLLGPMAAMNGILMFGWSTAVIFEVLRRTMANQSRRSDGGRSF
jgi:hypothetical protein